MNMNYILYCFLLCLSGFGLAQDASSSQSDSLIPSRYSVAVLDFEVTAVSGESNLAIGRAMAAAFDAPLVQTQRFTVVTRADLKQILEEISIQHSGIISPEEAQRLGEISGAEIVVTGSVIVNTDNSYTITARFIDVATGQIRAADTNEANNTREFPEVAEAFVRQAIVAFPKQGQVIAIENDVDIFINIGTETGLFAADKNGIISRIRYINEIPFEAQIATFTIVEASSQASRVQIIAIEDGYSIEVGDIVTIESPRLAEREEPSEEEPSEEEPPLATELPAEDKAEVEVLQPELVHSPTPAPSRRQVPAFASGSCGNLSMDDARALIEVLEFAGEKRHRPYALTSDERQLMLDIFQRTYPDIACDAQFVTADMRRIYQEVARGWDSLTKREQDLFITGVLLLLDENKGAVGAAQLNIACSTFACFYEKGYWHWGPFSATSP